MLPVNGVCILSEENGKVGIYILKQVTKQPEGAFRNTPKITSGLVLPSWSPIRAE